MTHDPLCPAYEHAEEHYDDYWCSDRCKAPCQCDLIREVRDSERLTQLLNTDEPPWTVEARREAAAELTRLAQEMGLIT